MSKGNLAFSKYSFQCVWWTRKCEALQSGCFAFDCDSGMEWTYGLYRPIFRKWLREIRNKRKMSSLQGKTFALFFFCFVFCYLLLFLVQKAQSLTWTIPACCSVQLILGHQSSLPWCRWSFQTRTWSCRRPGRSSHRILLLRPLQDSEGRQRQRRPGKRRGSAGKEGEGGVERFYVLLKMQNKQKYIIKCVSIRWKI